jgi:hypothetical protein
MPMGPFWELDYPIPLGAFRSWSFAIFRSFFPFLYGTIIVVLSLVTFLCTNTPCIHPKLTFLYKG